MTYRDQFEPYYCGIDTILIDIRHVDSGILTWHLCPYMPEDKKIKTKAKIDKEIKEAFSTDSMLLRVKVIDKIIAECVTL